MYLSHTINLAMSWLHHKEIFMAKSAHCNSNSFMGLGSLLHSILSQENLPEGKALVTVVIAVPGMFLAPEIVPRTLEQLEKKSVDDAQLRKQEEAFLDQVF